MGRPVIGCEVCILDDDGNVLPPGQVGEIAGHGAGMMARYHRRDEQTAALIWRDARGRSWIRSGDVGKLDEQASAATFSETTGALHPSAEGHAAMADSLMLTMRPMLYEMLYGDP